jgi:bacillithiol system protein YtxJ
MIPPSPIHTLRGMTAEAVVGDLPSTGLAFLYKHSFRCGISLTAREEVEIFAADRPDIPVYQLDVIAQRPVSQGLAALLRVPHASPQLILLRDRAPIWTATHSRITSAAMTAAVSREPEESPDRRAS